MYITLAPGTYPKMYPIHILVHVEITYVQSYLPQMQFSRSGQSSSLIQSNIRSYDLGRGFNICLTLNSKLTQSSEAIKETTDKFNHKKTLYGQKTHKANKSKYK